MHILVDIGGTKTRVATATADGEEITVLQKFSTPEDPAVAVEEISDVVRESEAGKSAAICVGLAGTVAADGRSISRSPNLTNWQGFPLAEKLSQKTEADTVYLVNDTALGALGEAHEGAGTDTGVMGYLTVGTGVGGSRVVDGSLDTARFGFEPGHQVVNMDAFLAHGDDIPPEGRVPGHLEYYLSGANFERKTGKKPPEIKDEKLWEEFQDQLVAALINVSVMWAPDVIVIGGSMIFRNEFLSFAYLQKKLEKRLSIYPEVPTIQRAVLQDDAGLVGAQVFLQQQK